MSLPFLEEVVCSFLVVVFLLWILSDGAAEWEFYCYGWSKLVKSSQFTNSSLILFNLELAWLISSTSVYYSELLGFFVINW